MRPGSFLLFLALFAGAAATGSSLGNTAPIALHSNPAGNGAIFVPVAAKKSAAEKTRAQQCKTLNRCRWYFAHCEKKFLGSTAPGPRRDAAREACVDTYRACIKKGFPSGGLFFTRWFVPGECT